MPKSLIGIIRDENDRIQRITSDSTKFHSERDMSHYDFTGSFGEGWMPEREMKTVPLYLSDEQIMDRRYSCNYQFLPTELTTLLERGILRTSGQVQTDYSVLMSVTEKRDKPQEGRTGILLYKGEPVTVNIKGKDFAVEIKGVGSPDGDNTKTDSMVRSSYFGQGVERYGGLDDTEGIREFKNLEILQEKSKILLDGEGVRVAALMIYKNDTEYGYKGERQDQAYLIRLTPGNIRSSFNSNPDIPQLSDRELVLTSAIGRHYAELASLDEVLLHDNLHPENILRTGKGYVLTDFADCRKLVDIRDPHRFLKKTLDKIREVPRLTNRGINNFYSTITESLGLRWDESTGYDGFIQTIWNGYFAGKVYDLKKGNNQDAQDNIQSHKELLQMRRKKDELHYLDVEGARNFLAEEVEMLEPVKTPEAEESLRIAKERIAYLEGQLSIAQVGDMPSTDINRSFRKNPNSFYDLFILPYMKS